MPSFVADLRDQLASVPRSRVIIGGLAVLMTALMATGFLLESRWGYSPRDPKIIYFNSWRADRTDADVAADQARLVTAARADAAQSRAYIATLSGGARVAAQNQYDAYLAAQPKSLQPPGFVAPKPQ